MPPHLFALVIFWIGSGVYAWASLDCGLPIYASCKAGMTGHTTFPSLLINVESCEFFVFAGLELRSSQSLPPE
jgi:hypothetical protein